MNEFYSKSERRKKKERKFLKRWRHCEGAEKLLISNLCLCLKGEDLQGKRYVKSST